MITIGVVYGGPESRDSDVFDALTAVSKAAISARGDFEFGSAPAVNVVFHVPGSLSRPDWDGMRDARFSRKKKLLMVQVALPDEVVSSDRAIHFIIEALHGANAVAFDVYQKKGMQYPLREAETVVNKIEELAKHML